MLPTGIDQRIKYILERRFPEYFSLAHAHARALQSAKNQRRLEAALDPSTGPVYMRLRDAATTTSDTGIVDTVVAPAVPGAMMTLQAELEQKSADELQALYEDELRNERTEDEQHERRRRQQEEDARFFNQPNAGADFSYWSKAAYWTLDEGIALILGRAPDVVTWERVTPFRDASPFAARFARIRELVQRAKKTAQLRDPELPRAFLAWARSYLEDDDVVPAIVEALEKQDASQAPSAA